MLTQIRARLLVLLLLTACSKDDPEAGLPSFTQEGLNTGGFLLDGVAYTATGWPGAFLSGSSVGPLEGGYLTWGGGFLSTDYSLRLNSELAGRYATVTLFLRNPNPSEFTLNRTTGMPPAAVDSTIFNHATVGFRAGNGEIYTTDAQHIGRIILTRADRTALLSAGTFEFTAVSNLDPSKTIRVSAGRFDRRQ